MEKPEHLKRGKDAENACYRYLSAKGLRLVEKNFHCRFGEIDLIMLDQSTLVFIEVRFRKNNAFGGAAASITPNKQLKIRRTAEYYLQRYARQSAARFDVVAMSHTIQKSLFHRRLSNYTFNWIQNAF